jgi:SAM-dependent methyltransferase
VSCCPLCASGKSRPSWLGALSYHGRRFPYVECLGCQSLYADPMPTAETLTEMYGPAYVASATDGHDNEDPKEPKRVLDWVSQHPLGTFVDYGCGPGRLLADIKRNGWNAIGVEFHPEVAADIERRIGVPVASRHTVDELVRRESADVLHLGDVIEHLTNPAIELTQILHLVKRGGYLIAQGPLEAHPTLFTAVLKLSRRLRSAPVSEMPPYHVMLATAPGQRMLFERLGLRTVEFSMHEVAWPAPARLRGRDALRPRALTLFALRRLSQLFSAMQPQRWGNRYFYVGRRA